MYLERKEQSAALQPCKPAWYGTGLEFSVNTFLGDLKLAALGNLDRLDGLVAGSLGYALNLVDDLVALEHLAEDDVASVQPACDDRGNEELAAVGVFAGVGHAEKALAGVLELEVLIRELCAVDGLSASTVSSGEITLRVLAVVSCVEGGRDLPALDHELVDDAVEGGSLISEALLASSKGTETSLAKL
jgi:hypothetical protein